MTNEEDTKAEQAVQMPALYENITPLLTNVHKDLKMKVDQNYEFSAKVNSVPITMQELPTASKYFPVIFAGDKTGTMLAVLGIRPDDNLFVDKNYNWLPNTYVPAYIRRYPFFTARRDGDSDAIICIDDTSDFLSTDGEKPLFDNEKPTDMLNSILEFTRNYQHQLELSGEFGIALEKLGLLEDQQISFKIGEEVKANVNGFRTISRTKFDELDGQVLQEWLGKGWLDAAILHLSSGSNFDRLWQLHRERYK